MPQNYLDEIWTEYRHQHCPLISGPAEVNARLAFFQGMYMSSQMIAKATMGMTDNDLMVWSNDYILRLRKAIEGMHSVPMRINMKFVAIDVPKKIATDLNGGTK